MMMLLLDWKVHMRYVKVTVVITMYSKIQILLCILLVMNYGNIYGDINAFFNNII